MRVQGEDQPRPVLDDSNPRVATTVDSLLMALGQAEPSLEIEIVLDLLELSRADEKAGQKLTSTWPCAGESDPHSARTGRSLLELRLPIFVASPSGSSVAAILSMSLTYFRIGSCSAWTCSDPRSMQPASRSSCFSVNPLFSRPSSVGSTREPLSKPRPLAGRVAGVGLPDCY